jgi:tetratricopeptide (TPR) repeat protein
MAWTYEIERGFGWGNSQTDYDAKVLGLADRAIALAPNYDASYLVKGFYLGMSHRFDQAIRAADAGLAVNPNNPRLYSVRALGEISLGRFDEAKSDLQQAIRLSPRDPLIRTFQVQLGDVEIGAGRLESALAEYKKALDLGDHDYWDLCKPRRLLYAFG